LFFDFVPFRKLARHKDDVVEWIFLLLFSDDLHTTLRLEVAEDEERGIEKNLELNKQMHMQLRNTLVILIVQQTLQSEVVPRGSVP